MAFNHSKTSSLEDLHIRANALLAQNCPEHAETLYHFILNQRREIPDQPRTDDQIEADVYFCLGMIAESRGCLDDAIKIYEKSVAADHLQNVPWLFLAKAYLEKYQTSQNPRDFYLGRKAIQWAEEAGCTYPVLGWLKKEYQKVS